MNSKMIIVLGTGLLIAFALYKFVPDDMTPLQRGVSNELRNQGFKDVDVKALDKDRVSELNLLLFSKDSPGDIRDRVREILSRP